MYDLKHLQELLELIEDPKNRNCFKGLLNACEFAKFLAGYLYNNGAIGDNEKLNLLTRIDEARTKVINARKRDVKKMINDMQILGTVGSLVDFIYGELLG